MAKKIYWTKCGIEFQKSSTADVTGYELNELDGRLIVQNCIECPFPIEIKDGWGEAAAHKRWECRAGSEKPNHKTEWTGSLDDKNTIGINSLDIDLMDKILQYCKDHPDLSAGYNTDHLADCRRTLSISCSTNKKGIAAKRELIEKFFPDKAKENVCPKYKGSTNPKSEFPVIRCGESFTTYGKDKTKDWEKTLENCLHSPEKCCLSPLYKTKAQEVKEVKQDCTTCLFVKSSDKPGKVNCSEHTKKKDFIPTSDCPQYAPAEKNSVNIYIEDPEWDDKWNGDSDEKEYPSCNLANCPFNDCNHNCLFEGEDPQSEGFNRDVLDAVEGLGCKSESVLKQYEAINNTDSKTHGLTCDSCSYKPVKANKACNRVGNDRAVEPGGEACGWYDNVKTGEMAPQQFEWNYEGSYPECIYKDFPDSHVKRIYYTISEVKLPKDTQTVNGSETDERADVMNHNDHCCGNCSYYTGDNKANYHCNKLSAYKDSYGVPLPDAQGCGDFRNKWSKTGNGTPEIVTQVAEIDTKTAETVTFDYSIVDAETAAYLQEKIKKINEIRIKSVIDLGRELKEAHDRLANHYKGTFGKWCESIGLSRDSGNNYIRAYEYVAENFGNLTDAEKLQPSLLFAVSKTTAPKELQEQVLSGDITTHKQYKEKEAEWRSKVDEVRAQQDSLRVEKQQAITKAFDAERKVDRLEGEIEELRDQLDELKDQAEQQDPQIITTLQDRIHELEKELKDKPIETAAVQVVEKIPVRAAYETIHRLYGTLMAAKIINNQDIHIVHEHANFEMKEAIIEFFENLLDMIPGYLDILKDNVPTRKCEDCHYCEWEDLKEEDELKGLIYCKFHTPHNPQLWPNEKACENWSERRV